MKKTLLLVMAAVAVILGSVTAHAAGEWTKYRIMIDPGHGGTDPGASGPTKPHEAELALACAKKLQSFITTNLSGTVKLTRTTDTYISLTARKSASVSYDPYIFCAIHLNAFNGTANGTETWYYHSTGNSKNLANRVHNKLISEMGRTNRGVKQNGWTVITGSPSVPAILTEGLFVDNKTEHDLIKDMKGEGFLNWVRGHLYGFYTHLNAIAPDAALTNPAKVAAISGSSGSTTTTPTLKVSPTTITSELTYSAGVKDTVSFTVSGSNLTDAVSISSDNANVKVLKTSLTASSANKGYDINVQWTPAAIGTETAKITVKSGTLTKTVTFNGTANAAPLKVEAAWLCRQYNGSESKFGWDATKVRNLAYSKGKLYMVYNQKEIRVVNAQTGADLGTLSTKGLTGGVITLCDVVVFKNQVYACNIGNSADAPLKIYRWADDHADPEVVLETTKWSTASRAGDCMTMTGDLTDGKVVFANDNGSVTNILIYPITNGTFSKTPTVVKATKSDGTTQLSTGASTRCYMTTSGTFWITGQHAHPTYLDATGKQSYFINGNETWGNDFVRFKYNSDTQNYAVVTEMSEINNVNYLKGQFRLIQKGDSWTTSKNIQTLPSAGLSETVSNTSCASSLAVSSTTVDSKNVIEIWLAVNGQGVCYYRSKGDAAPTYTVEPVGPVTTPEPTLTVASTTVTIPETCVGQTSTSTVKVTGADLVNDIAVDLTDATGMFTVTPATIANSNGAASKNITVTYKPTAAGSHTAKIKVSTKNSSGTAISKTITVNASAYETVAPGYDTKVSLTKDWEFSTAAGNLTQADWFSASAPFTRHIAATPSKLYVLSSSAWNTTPSITVVDPATGATTGSVNLTGITGGESILAGIDVLDGKLIAANGARTQDTFKVYRWSADNAEPTVILSDDTHGSIYAGEMISVTGNWTSGAIYTSNGSKVLRYDIANNVVASTPAVITLTKDGAPYSVGDQKAKTQVAVNPDGTFWVTGKDKHPTLFSADGQYINEMESSHVGGSVHGTSGRVFQYGTRTLGAFTTYTQPDSQTLSGGAMALVDLTDNSAPAHMSLQPQQGLGTERNTEFQTSVAHAITDTNKKLELYVAVPKQGVAKYSYTPDTANAVIDLETAANEKDTRWYTVTGQQINRPTAPGLYLRSCGATTTKVLVK